MLTEGFLVIDKPVGISSFDVIRRLRRQLGKVKMGHTGTLDPLATGVLPIAIGRSATRSIPTLPTGKAYEATMILGKKTTTDDMEGDCLAETDASGLTEAVVTEALVQNFAGDFVQKPPVFSAVHHQGKRLYDLARKGKPLSWEQLPERSVKVTDIAVRSFVPGTAATLQCSLACSAGTYIRSIARDLGELLGVGGCLAALRRTLANGFTLDEAVALEEASWDAVRPLHN